MTVWEKLLSIVIITIVYCEYAGDFVATLKCSWPQLKSDRKAENAVLRAMLLADPHLLGPIRGNWLDKLYREWHMRRAFQAAVALMQPDVVFVLGDLFDEGDFVNHQQFEDYVQRFQRHFHTPHHMPVISAVGNHDIGFHYKMHPYFTDRFEHYFNNTGVSMYTLQDIHFVFINSMAMENDGCYFCDPAQRELHKLSEKLACLKRGNQCEDRAFVREHKVYSRPIILQHFPTYRVSDKICHTTDSPVIEKYRENWDVLSKEATDLLGKLLNPRLSFTGHTHHYCHATNRWGVDEYTVASFSWRNKVNPSFLLASLTTTEHQVAKCDMLQQQTVYRTYTVAVIMILSVLVYEGYGFYKQRQCIAIQCDNTGYNQLN